MPASENLRNFDLINLKHELQRLIQGNGGEGKKNPIQAIAHYLGTSKAASPGPEKNEHSKEQEAKALISYIDCEHLWYTKEIDEEHKIGEGAEQKMRCIL